MVALSSSAHFEAEAPRLVVCIATCLRPEGLSRLLRALAAADFDAPAPQVEIVVIDNDANGSARSTCDAAREWLPFDLHYAIEKARGIPQARNAALSIAMPIADFIVFTDDDVEPTRGWLRELMRVQSDCSADVVAGPNPPRFLSEPPSWIVEGGFFDCPRRPTGMSIDTAATNNVLIRRAVLERLDHWFDERFGLNGSDDTELFERIAQAGARMVWADEAVVFECVPLSRARPGWLLRRAFRTANALGSPALRELRGLSASDVATASARCFARGCLALAASVRQGTAERIRALRLLAAAAGWLTGLVGVGYREYGVIHGR